jgi:hypothetical protein
MANFIGDHIGTIVQFAVTAWFARIARDFQVTLSVYGTRLETTREAVRRGRVLWWLKTTDHNWTEIINEMMDWHATNEVFLTPTAARAFLDIHLLKGLQGSMPSGSDLREHFQKADQGLKTLSIELLRFRKRPLGDLLWDRAGRIFRKNPSTPRVEPVPRP